MKNARVVWGCDEPAPGTVFEVTCSKCAGSGYVESTGDGCLACGGSGLFSFDRCPTAVLSGMAPWDRVTMDHLMRSYLQYDSRHVMPLSGGYSDQSAFWCSAVDVIDSERGRLESMLEEKQERERKAAEARAKKQQQSVPRRR